jgi:hypothetical protein
MQFFIWYSYLKSWLIEWYRKAFEKCACCGKKSTETISCDGEDIVVCDECFEVQLELMFYRKNDERGDNYGEE